MKYFQIKTDDIAELEDLLEAAINLHATHYILESDDAKEYFDGTPLPKARQDLKERKLKEQRIDFKKGHASLGLWSHEIAEKLRNLGLTLDADGNDGCYTIYKDNKYLGHLHVTPFNYYIKFGNVDFAWEGHTRADFEKDLEDLKKLLLTY